MLCWICTCRIPEAWHIYVDRTLNTDHPLLMRKHLIFKHFAAITNYLCWEVYWGLSTSCSCTSKSYMCLQYLLDIYLLLTLWGALEFKMILFAADTWKSEVLVLYLLQKFLVVMSHLRYSEYRATLDSFCIYISTVVNLQCYPQVRHLSWQMDQRAKKKSQIILETYSPLS